MEYRNISNILKYNFVCLQINNSSESETRCEKS